MDNSRSKSNPNPRDKANIFSILTWTWTFNIFKTGYNKILAVDDLYDPVDKDRANALGDRLEKQWFAQLEKMKKKKHKPSLFWAICRTFSSEILLLGFVQFINELIIRLGTPFLLGALLRYFKPGSNTPYETAIYFATAIVGATMVSTLLFNQLLFNGYHLGGRLRIAVCSVIYRKALRLSKTALGETAPGKIVNLVASDVNRFEVVFLLLHYMWSAPLSTIVVMILLYLEVGWSAFVGMSIIFLVAPFQGYLGKLSSKYRLQTSLKTDERIRLMDEIISGVQVIKMYAWEKPFCALVELARRLELKIVTKSSYIRGIYMTFFLFTTRMALYGMLTAMLLRGQEITVEKVFVYISYLNLISLTMCSMFVRGIAETAESKVAINRIQNFLMYEEYESTNIDKDSLSTPVSKADNISISKPVKGNMSKPNGNLNQNIVMPADDMLNHKSDRETNFDKHKGELNTETWSVKLNHVTAKWNLHSAETTLDDIDVEIAKGKLYIVIGMVGAGKSSFISTILGEMKLLQGSSEVKGRLSYADQDAWVFGASVRQNIIFGQEFNRQRYTKVVKVCALQKDFQQFPHGDQTVVGERGNSLSGGQKARINLARAVYRQADIYLLDDPLSAVDAHVGKHLFEECLQKYLAGKTRILATHQLQYIKGADAILHLDQGKIQQFVDYQQLLRIHPEYNSLIAAEEEGTEESAQRYHGGRRLSSSSTRSRTSESLIDIDEEENDEEIQQDTLFEGTSRGTVKGNLFWNYVRSGSSSMVVLLVLVLYLATQTCVSLNDYFIPILVKAEESREYYKKLHKNGSLPNSDNSTEKFLLEEDILPRDYYIYIFTGLVTSIFVVGILRSFTFYTMCLSASQRLHDLVFAALIRAKMLFFDTNPSGRILNRFSKDLGAIDELLPRATLDASQTILTMLGAVTVACTVNVWFLIPVVVIGALFILIRKVYLETSKNIKRLEGITRSPVFTHLNATLNGITTIRAYQAGNILKEEFDKLQDTHTSSWFMFIATSVAFAFSLDVCCLVFTGVVTFSFVLLKESFSGGDVGLAITQVMSLTGLLQWGMRQSAEVTNQLMSVERVLEYSQLPSEPNLRDKGILTKKTKKLKKGHQEEILLVEPPKEWPSKGWVEFRNVFMRYTDDDPPVLKNLSLIIRPSEKIGVVGRTGAGKSSLISALFRLAKVQGTIEIDGFNTGTIALEDLRKHISIIPQDPVLFSGTLRRNLDPFNEFSDKHLWEVLEEVELKESVKLSGNGLDHRVLDRGSNYSTGQRQLICLARAILRNNRILMLDEATANVDPHTDALIQRTIRTKFALCTVLTVAHRLNTIMDSDKVLVMDKGELVEFDHPYILLQNEHGPFTSLVKETGRAMYEQLCKVAQDSYEAKKGHN